ncbi:MAG: D-alanyl-D-alanine carboxypeptidase/D-alanyl-D-alanine-endopeptidase [Gemmatimonadota bacterium]
MHVRAFAALAALATLGSAAGCAPRAARGGHAPRTELAATLDRALADPALRQTGAAVLVVSLDRGDTLYSREPDRLYTPASNLKLFTAATALHVLGADHRFRTALVATGPVRGDTLLGDLVLIGRGDPDLVTAHLAALADTVAARGIRAIRGDVRADPSWFDAVEWGAGWMWDDGPYWYWPFLSALTVNDNTVSLRLRPGAAPGAPVAVALDPPTDYMTVRVTATTGPAGSPSTLDVDRHWTPRRENVIDVTGSLPLNADSLVEVRSVEDPALYAVTLLTELLAARGVQLTGTVRHGPLDPREAAADTLARHDSDSLAVSVRNFLKISDNLTGELLLKAIGAVTAGPPGSYAKGLAAERAFLADAVGLDTLALRLADGSGVSRYNLVTARQLVHLLAYMAGRSDLGPVYAAALPIAGVDGTLENRLGDTAAARRALAKTGSLEGVSTISGYVLSAEGERLAFSVLMEFYVGSTTPRRVVQDSLVAALARFRR